MACKKHPQYKGKAEPRGDCKDCWAIFDALGHTTKKLKGVREKRELKRAATQAVDQIEVLQEKLAAAFAIKSHREELFGIVPFPALGGSEATAFVVASDWHIEETVRSEEVNGLNEYSLALSKKRAERFFQVALHLTNLERKNTPIKTLVVAVLGDMITGRIHEENLEVCTLRPVDAAIRVQTYLRSGIEFLLRESDLNLLFVCCSGNHSRITKKIHAATEEGNSLETFVYQSLAQLYVNEPRVRFQTTSSYHNYLKVYDTVLRFHHGHSIRYWGGVGGITIPVNKKINEWNKSKWADLDVFGHFHQMFDGGNFIANGSMIGFNAFALRIGAAYEQPKQVFFVINKRWKEKILVRPILFD